MGWKTLKERFEIDHIVHVTNQGVCVGDHYAPNILTIDSNDGSIREHRAFRGFGREHCPQLMEASPEEILGALAEEDSFSASIPVYALDGSEVLEKRCEKPGWPNVTHDDCLICDELYSTDMSEVIGWAQDYARAEVRIAKERVAEIGLELAEMQSDLAAKQKKLEALEHLGSEIGMKP